MNDSKARLKKLFFLLVYFFLAACSVVIALEVLVRVLSLAPPLPPQYTEFIKDSYLPFKAAPNRTIINDPWPEGHEFQFEFRTNSLGFRDSVRPFSKPRDVFRILTLGDSFTMGAGARHEGTYPFQLQELFNRRSGDHPRVEVINAGQIRYWPEPERILLETTGIRFRPDIVMVGFNVGDVQDTYEGINYPAVRRGYLVTREAYELGDAGVWLYIHSHLFRKIAALLLHRLQENLSRSSTAVARWRDIFVPDGPHEKDWLLVESEYETMRRVANRIKAALVIVYIPLKKEDNNYPLERLMAWGRDHRVTVIDPTRNLQEAALHQQVYWKEDVHCTEAGYRVIAETVFAKLTEMNAVP
jgi:lysophospholipase L1-like esterase